MYAFGDYRSPLKDIILNFKFRGITSPAKTFAGLIAEKFAEQLSKMNAQAVVPVPLHPGRRNRRGYNQAELLSRELALILKVPLLEDALFRIKRRRPQSRLKFAKRKSNVAGVFEAMEPVEKIKRVILVDDVVTSGATVLEAKKCLEKIDYKVTGIVAIAHGL
jgi:ComF family protein